MSHPNKGIDYINDLDITNWQLYKATWDTCYYMTTDGDYDNQHGTSNLMLH